MFLFFWGGIPINPKPAKGTKGQPESGEPEFRLRHFLKEEEEEGGCWLPLPLHTPDVPRASLV